MADTPATTTPPTPSLTREIHIQFFRKHVEFLPEVYKSLDTNRLSLLYFALQALDVLGAIDTLNNDVKAAIIAYLHAMQVLPEPGTGNVERCGFRGGTYVGVPFDCCAQGAVDHHEWVWDEGHLAMTYCALCCLAILGDDFSRVDKKGVIGALRGLQQSNGSFCPTRLGGESDIRFIFCACAISTMLDDWSGFDLDRATDYIIRSQSYDGGIGMGPHSEGHGGTTYCAIASLSLMNRLSALRDAPSLLRWGLINQGEGFRGRPEKPQDTCYSFWMGATLQMLGAYDLTEREGNRKFNLSCQTSRGGFGKQEPGRPDLLHSCYGLCGLSFIGLDDGLSPLDPRLGLTLKTAARFRLPPIGKNPLFFKH